MATWSFSVIAPAANVVEFKNLHLNHYFLTVDPTEMAAIDAGAAGPGWIRTGFGFAAYSTLGLCGDCVPVSRFYGTPGLGPNSHFYTADVAESEGLKRLGSGWSFERLEFAISPPQGSACAAGVPVYRLYNNRWMFNDSNHRYVTSASERAAMQAQGWIDEGVHFCAQANVEIPIEKYSIEIDLDRKILPSAQCEDESVNLGGCLAVNNLPVPNLLVGPYSYPVSDVFTRYTGLSADRAYVPTRLAPDVAARNVFVQGDDLIWGLHIDSRERGPSPYASINPLYQMRTTTSPGAPDRRFFPWARGYPFETQLSFTAAVNVMRVNLRGPNSHAYGHPTIEFIDQKSGHHLYYTVLAYGTIAGGDFVAPDVATGKVIVGTTARDGSPFGRNFGSVTFSTPSGLEAGPSAQSRFGRFDFRVDRAEFQRILDAARQADPALSANPADYLVDNFHFNNEVVGDAEIGMNLYHVSLRVMRR